MRPSPLASPLHTLAPTRRAVLAGTASLLGATASSGAALAAPAIDADQFLVLSQAVTGRQRLHPETANRILRACSAGDGSFAAKAAQLASLAKGTQSPEALLELARAANLQDIMMQVVTAWYTGTVGHGSQAQLISYVDALMYQPAADGLVVPTYCPNGPLWWTADPPAAGVEAPREAPPPRPAPAPQPAPAETPKAN